MNSLDKDKESINDFIGASEHKNEAEGKDAEQQSNSGSSASLNSSSKTHLLKQLALQSIIPFLLNEAFSII